MSDRVVRALVIGRVDYRDTDRVMRLLTAEHGRIAAMARGARASKRRFGGALELGCEIDAVLKAGRGSMETLQRAELVHPHAHIRDHLETLALAAYFCDWIEQLARESQPEPRLFGLLQVGLRVLDACTEPPVNALRVAFEAKALTFSGLTPRLTVCGGCGQAVDDETVYDFAGGGAQHRRCGPGAPVSRAFLLAVESARRTPLAECVDTELPAGPTWLLHDHLAWHQGRALRSRDVLQQLGV